MLVGEKCTCSIMILIKFDIASYYPILIPFFSFGPLVWLLVSELFHSSIRGRALGASTIITYLAGAIVSNSFLTVQDTFGEWVPFVIYCILTFLSIIFVALAIPETSNKDPESIHVELTSLWWWQKRESEFENSRDIDISNRVV